MPDYNNTNVPSFSKKVRLLRDKFKYKGPVEFNKKLQLVIPGDFDCSDTNLTSLEGSPDIVTGYYDCNRNKLTSLEGAPKEVGGGFYCSDNNLTSLKYSPTIGGGFFCRGNKITSLVGVPKIIHGSFNCDANNLTSLEGAPKIVNGSFSCEENKLTSLTGIPIKINGRFIISVFPDTPILKLLGVSGVAKFVFFKPNEGDDNISILSDLFKKFYGGGVRGQLQCGIEMMRLGYGSNARL